MTPNLYYLYMSFKQISCSKLYSTLLLGAIYSPLLWGSEDDAFSVLDSDVIFEFNENYQTGFDKLNIEYNHQKKDYAVLNQSLYENQRFRIFNYTAYDRDDLKTVMGANNPLDSVSSLSISFGYGVEYLTSDRNKIGYEFLSSFPYDRGELIRIFWVRIF